MPLQPLRKKIGIITYPLSVIYGSIVSLRNVLFNCHVLKSTLFNLPVISVGNITVGGTGKTPHIEYLIRLLKDDVKVSVLSRGYKRKTKDFLLASKNTQPKDIGDEPFQMYTKYPEIPVAVDRKRVHGIEELQKRIPGLKAVLLDDAYQHRYVTPGISILLIDYYRPVFKDYLLPFGDLREKRREIKRANIVIITKCPSALKPIEKRLWIKELHLYPYQVLYFTTFKYGMLIPVFKSEKYSKKPEDVKLNSPDVLLVSGIANPEPLEEQVKKWSKYVHTIRYHDHHDYTNEDIKDMIRDFGKLNPKNRITVTTEKDAVKIKSLNVEPGEFKENLFYLPVNVGFLENKKQFDSNIRDYVTKNKRIGRLYK